MLRQMHVYIMSDTQQILSSDYVADIMQHNFLHFVGSNIISYGPTNGLSICQLPKAQTLKLQSAHLNVAK